MSTWANKISVNDRNVTIFSLYAPDLYYSKELFTPEINSRELEAAINIYYNEKEDFILARKLIDSVIYKRY
jgi:hypothetical protein